MVDDGSYSVISRITRIDICLCCISCSRIESVCCKTCKRKYLIGCKDMSVSIESICCVVTAPSVVVVVDNNRLYSVEVVVDAEVQTGECRSITY